MRAQRLLLLAVPAVLAAGCGKEPYKLAPVSGRVTLNGKPLENAAVMFQPVVVGTNNNPGPGSAGVTDAEGRYTLTVVGQEAKGAVVGKHKVRVTMYQKDDSADDRPKRVKQVAIPAKYNRNTGLEYDVPADGTGGADFPLNSP
jgi:hypothetical protein